MFGCVVGFVRCRFACLLVALGFGGCAVVLRLFVIVVLRFWGVGCL